MHAMWQEHRPNNTYVYMFSENQATSMMPRWGGGGDSKINNSNVYFKGKKKKKKKKAEGEYMDSRHTHRIKEIAPAT